MQFVTPKVGVAEPVEGPAGGVPIRRILAPNPSPMTYWGTNTYLLGRTDLAVIDPGPANPQHLRAILAAVGSGQQISHILVTHSHLDHSPLAASLAQETGAQIYGFGPSGAGRSAVMTELANAGLGNAGEGVDPEFSPDICLEDGAVLEGSDWNLTGLWTPGHLGNHLCFQMEDMVFCGDLVMGWASSLVSPPDGDLTDFMASCQRLQKLAPRLMHAGHGAPIEDPTARLRWLIAHRLSREQAILDALQDGPASARTLAERIYTETPADLLPAATRNVLAHLIDLYSKSKVSPLGALSENSRFQLE